MVLSPSEAKSRKGKMTVAEAGKRGGKKTAQTMAKNSIVQSVAKEDQEGLGNMKVHPRQEAKQALKKQDTKADKESEN
jgi:hypothetical protein